MTGYAYGDSATVEPEGFELESATWSEPCPKCQAQAVAWRYEVAEGSLNIYRGRRCNACGHAEGEHPRGPLGHARVSGAGPLARRASGPARSADRHRSRACRHDAPPPLQKGRNPCRPVLECPP